MSINIHERAAERCADAVELAVRNVLESQPRCVLATAGGSTPVKVFEALHDRLNDVFDKLTVTLVDERHLGQTGPWNTLPDESNTRLLYSAWLAAQPSRPTVVGWALEGTVEQAAEVLTASVPDPDVLLLGSGPDAHIASLFPGHPVLTRSGRILSLTDSPKPPSDRLTMSLELLRSARHALVLFSGTSKAEAAARSIRAEPGLPLTFLAANGGPAIQWFLDGAAASLLEYK